MRGRVVRCGARELARELADGLEARGRSGSAVDAAPAFGTKSPRQSRVASLSGRLSNAAQKAMASPRASHLKKTRAAPTLTDEAVQELRRFEEACEAGGRAGSEAARKQLLASPESAAALNFALSNATTSKSASDFQLGILAMELAGALCELAEFDKDTQNLFRTSNLLEHACLFLHTSFSRPKQAAANADWHLTAYHVRCALVLFNAVVEREANRDTMVKSGGAAALALALEDNSMAVDQNLVSDAAILLSNASFGDDKRKAEIGRSAIGSLEKACARHQNTVDVVMHVALAYRNLSYNCEPNQILIVSENEGAALKQLLVFVSRFCTLDESKDTNSQLSKKALQQRVAVHQALVALANITAIREDLREKVVLASALETVMIVVERANTQILALEGDLVSALKIEDIGRDVDDVVAILRNSSAKTATAQQRIGTLGLIGTTIQVVQSLCGAALRLHEASSRTALSNTLASGLVDRTIEWLRHAAFLPENRERILSCGALTNIIVAAIVHAATSQDGGASSLLREARACEAAILALGNSVFNAPPAIDAAGRAGAVEAVVGLARKHGTSLEVARSALRCLRALVEKNERNGAAFMECGALGFVVDQMRRFPSEDAVQEQGCALLLGSSLNDGNLHLLRQSGAHEVAMYAIEQHPKHRGIHLHAALLLQRLNGASADDVRVSRANVERLARTARLKRRGTFATKSIFSAA